MAFGYQSSNGFMVLRGSVVSYEVTENFKTSETTQDAYRERLGLVETGTVVDGVFAKDYLFSSSSQAASVLLGRNAVGDSAWVKEFQKKGVKKRRSNSKPQGSQEGKTKKIGELAYEYIKELVESGRISETEIEKLKTKEYTKKLFSKTGFPVLANSIDENRYAGDIPKNRLRYYKIPIDYKGKKLYVTREWFRDDMQNLEKWYQSHLEKDPFSDT